MPLVERILDLPDGDVTFLFTDIEGSTRLLERFGPRLTEAMAVHHDLVGAVIADHGGVVFETVGDAVYAAFRDPIDGVLAAADAQRAMGAQAWADLGEVRIRVAVHQGRVERRGAHYLGPALFRAARILALGHGGQVLLSDAIVDGCAGRLPRDLDARPMGRHRLKDLVDAESVWQLTGEGLIDGFPPLRAVDARVDVLPRSPSSFVGRAGELARVAFALEGARLVTLVGPGGTGKTRLAVETAVRVVARFRDGVAFVDLAPIRDPRAIPGAIAAVLGLRAIGDEGPDGVLGRWLEHRELLLIADNLEQIPGAAAAVTAVLERAPAISILATSRERLLARGERVVVIDPLPSAGDHHARLPDAALLFLDRAGIEAGSLAEADRDALLAIVRRLDGLPLAIEIAAARAHSVALPILERVLAKRLPDLPGPSDLPDRQRTLHATVDWSLDLLELTAGRRFPGTSVFAGGWSLPAVGAVLEPGIEEDEAVLLMAALVDRSLVRTLGTDPLGQPRYGLLETTRQVAADRLGPAEAEALRRRHAAWMAGLVEIAEQGIQTADADRWHGLLDLERYNLEAALDHATASRDAITAQRIVGAVWRWVWTRLGGAGGIVSRMRAAIALPDPTPPRIRARALIAFGAVAQAVDGPERIEPALREAIDLLAPLGPSNDLAEAWCTLGAVRSNHGQLEQSGAAMEQALTIWMQTGDAQGQAKALSNLSVDLIQSGDRAGAIACVDRFLDLIDDTFEPVNRRDLHAQASQMLTAAGELERARDHLGIAGRLRRARPGDDLFDLLHLGASATLLERLGDAEAAVRAHAAARQGAARLGLHTDFVATLLEPLEPTGLAPEHVTALEAEGRALLPDAAIDDAEAHLALGPARPRDATLAAPSDALA